MSDFDLFVIGAGSGGVRAARIAAGHGAKVGICEESRVGGTCVIRGCVPKKLLVYASRFSEEFADAAAYGWEVPQARFDWSRLIAAKDKEIDRLNGVYLKLLDNAGVSLFEGRGRLLDSHHVHVAGRTLSAEKILIATGGRPWVPDFEGSEHAIVSDHAFHLERLPQRILVVGGGYIACEFAGIFNGMGSEVIQAYRRDALLRGFDDDVRQTVTEGLIGKGIDVRLNTDVRRIREADGGYQVDLTGDKRLTVDQVMYCTGRRPYTGDLGLEKAGVATNAGGAIEVDEFSRTSADNIFAVGDVTDRINLTPVAIHEGHAFADSEFGNAPRPVDHRFVPSAVFSQPPVGSVGYGEQEAGDFFGRIRVYQSAFRPMKDTLSGRDGKMLMKVIVDAATDRVVGCHVVGPDAPEIVQGFAVAVKNGLRKTQWDATIGIHPTAAEELVTLRQPVNEGQ